MCLDPATGGILATVASGSVDDAPRVRRCRLSGRAVVGPDGTTQAVGDPAADLPADGRSGRRAGVVDHRRERQGLGRRQGRGALLGGVLPLVRRRGRADPRRYPDRSRRREQDHRASPAGRDRPPGHAVELPRRDGRPQDRPGAGRRLHDHSEAGQRNSPDGARSRRPDGRGRTAGRGRECAAFTAVRQGGVGHAGRPAGAKTLVHRIHRGRPRPAQPGQRTHRQCVDGTGRQRPVRGLRRCRPGRGHRGRDDRQDAQRRRSLYRRQPVLRRVRDCRRLQCPPRPRHGRAHRGPRIRCVGQCRTAGQRRHPDQGREPRDRGRRRTARPSNSEARLRRAPASTTHPLC